MNTITQPLREEHRELLTDIEILRVTADSISDGNLTPSTLSGIERSFDFLMRKVIPHGLAEDKAIYPVIQKLLGSSHCTEPMSHDHMVISNLTNELGYVRSHIVGLSVTEEQTRSLRRVLYGLHILVKTHIDKEEEHYIPLLEENLTPEEFTMMMDSLKIAIRIVADDMPVMVEGFKSSSQL
jgi:hemerythrin-like domain-containing protein